MSEPIDYSDRIAYVQVCLEVLQHFDLNGEWNNHPTLRKWGADHYGLTLKEFKEMEKFLDGERARVTPQLQPMG